MSFDMSALKLLCSQIGCEFRQNEPMREHTSFKIGGPADLFLIPSSEEQLEKLLLAISEGGLPLTLIGRGSNLLVRDEGIRGVVVAIGGKLSHMELISDCEIECEAGANLDTLCRFALDNALTGLEFAYGIPGSVGGAVYMNAGAYNGEMKDVLTGATHLTRDGKQESFTAQQMELSYRHSAYTNQDFCILKANFKLQKGDKDAIRARMDELKARRRDKQPLDYPSGGSTFKRPTGGYASALIDQCGLKGLRVGGAMVSEKHAGFLINYDRATCADMLALIEQVQKIVREKTGILLACEVKLV